MLLLPDHRQEVDANTSLWCESCAISMPAIQTIVAPLMLIELELQSFIQEKQGIASEENPATIYISMLPEDLGFKKNLYHYLKFIR